MKINIEIIAKKQMEIEIDDKFNSSEYWQPFKKQRELTTEIRKIIGNQPFNKNDKYELEHIYNDEYAIC